MTDAPNDTRRDARRALDDIERVQGKTLAFGGYAEAWPAFIVWGLIWFVANVTTYVQPSVGAWVWRAGIVIGVAASVWIGAAAARRAGESARYGRSAVMAAVIFLGLAALFAITEIRDLDQANAMISIICAVGYMILGLHRGIRLFAIGMVLGAAVLVGWFFARDMFALWMGLAGGGALIATGLWLKTA